MITTLGKIFLKLLLSLIVSSGVELVHFFLHFRCDLINAILKSDECLQHPARKGLELVSGKYYTNTFFHLGLNCLEIVLK